MDTEASGVRRVVWQHGGDDLRGARSGARGQAGAGERVGAGDFTHGREDCDAYLPWRVGVPVAGELARRRFAEGGTIPALLKAWFDVAFPPLHTFDAMRLLHEFIAA